MDYSSSHKTRISRRAFLQIALAAGGAILLDACGNSAPPQAEQVTLRSLPQTALPATTNTTDTVVALSTAPFAGQTLNLMMIQPHTVSGEVWAADFEALTGAKVNITLVPYEQTQAKITLDVQSGTNQFDVFEYWYTTLGAIASQGIAEDLTSFIEQNPEIDTADFIPSIYDPYTLYNGRRYGLPSDGDSHVLFYNTEIFARYHLSAPTTWDEYLNAARTISEAESKHGIYGCVLLGSPAPIIIGSSFANRLAGFGGRYFDERGQPILTSDAAKAAAKAMLDAAPYALPSPLNTGFDQALPAFLNGKAAMIEFWTDLGVFAQDPKQSKIMDKWDVVQIPVGGSNTQHISPLNAGFALAVSTGSKQKDLAREFIKYATSKQASVKLLTMPSGADPIRKSALQSKEYAAFAPKVQKSAVASLNGAFSWPNGPESPVLMAKLSDALVLMLEGKLTPDQAMDQAQKEWEAILKV